MAIALRSLLLVMLLVAAVAAAVAPSSKEEQAAEPEAKPAMGRCLCGKLQYAVSGSLANQNYCNCRDCQRAAGAFRVPFVVVQADQFKITAGKPKAFKAPKGTGVKCCLHGTYYFCADCGSHVYWKPHRGTTVDIFATTLDNPKVFTKK